jgi:DegV family protein with EDD domain
MIRIVTDSNAFFFEPDYAKSHNVRVVPLGVRVGDEIVLETSLTTEQLFKRANGGPLPKLEPPSPEYFAALFEELSQTTDTIVCVHFSGKLSGVPQNARAGAEALKGRTHIHVIDSATASIGLGALVEAAVREAERGTDAETLVKAVRGYIPQLYGVFFSDTMAYAARLSHIGRAHALLGEMLTIKPILALEEGDLLPIEKARTRAEAIEKLVEYSIEFDTIERCAIVQPTPRPTDDTRALLEQLAAELPGQKWPIITYSPSLATFLGPDSLGIIVLDGEGAD